MKEVSCKHCNGTGKVLVPDDDYAEDTGREYVLITQESHVDHMEYYAGEEEDTLQVPLKSSRKKDAIVFSGLSSARKQAREILSNHNIIFVPDPL